VKKLAILGASGHGKVLADTATLCGWNEVVFFDDAWPEKNICSHWKVSGNTESLINQSNQFDGVIVGIGNNLIRLEKSVLLKDHGIRLITLIHPKSIVSNYTKIEPGTFIAAGAIVQVDSYIGESCIINTGATIDHDCTIDEGVHISPSAVLSGAVSVSKRSWVGARSCIKQLINIGSDTVIGMGAVVIKDVPSGITVVGNPARKLNKV